MTKEEFLANIPKLEKVFIIHSNYTKCPYILCDEETFDDKVLFFIKKEEADAFAEKANDDKAGVAVIEISQQRLIPALASLPLYGVNAIEFIENGDKFLYQISEVIKIPAREDAKNPIFENPTLSLTMNYFMQELRKNKEVPDGIKLRELEEEMFVNITRAKFLMPVKSMNIDGKEQSSLIFLQFGSEKTMLPIFTDQMEYTRFCNDKRFKIEADKKLMVLDFPQMLSFNLPEEAAGYIVNPSGVSVVVTKEMLKNVRPVNPTAQN